MLKKLISFLGISFIALSTFATNETNVETPAVSINPIVGEKGKRAVVEVNLINRESHNDFQLNIRFSDPRIKFYYDHNNNDYLTDVEMTDRTDEHEVSARFNTDAQGNPFAVAAAFSLHQTLITPGDGPIIRFGVLLDAPAGVYECEVYQVRISHMFPDGSGIEVLPAPAKTTVTITEPEEIRYSDNQLFCNDIKINEGENARLALSYNSTSDVFEYSTDLILPDQVEPAGDVTFNQVVTGVDNFTNKSEWNPSVSTLKISGVYGGGRRDQPAAGGVQEIANVDLNTSKLKAGEYTIRVSQQALSNDDNDFTPEEYVAKLIVNSNAQLEKCETPTISIIDNKVTVHSDTEGAIYHTSIVAHDHKNVVHGENEPVELGGQYLITSYASAAGYADSEPATATLAWAKDSDINTGLEDINMECKRILLIRSVGDNIEINGTTASEQIALYDLNGVDLYSDTASDNITTIPYSCEKGHFYIITVGNNSIKYKF